MKEAICFLPTLPSMGEWSINIRFAFSQHWGFHYFIWPTPRVIVAPLRFVGFIVVVEEICTSVACDIGDMF